MEAEINHQAVRYAREVERAQSLFNRVLVCWAADVLELRRRGALVPSWGGRDGAVTPSDALHEGSPKPWSMKKAA